MGKISAKNRLSVVLYGTMGGELPTGDKEMFILNSAILMVETVVNISAFVIKGSYNFNGEEVVIPESKAKVFSAEAKGAMKDYICEVKGYKGLAKDVRFRDWFNYMRNLYTQNIESWAKEIQEKAFSLIKTFEKMEAT